MKRRGERDGKQIRRGEGKSREEEEAKKFDIFFYFCYSDLFFFYYKDILMVFFFGNHYNFAWKTIIFTNCMLVY